MQPAGGSGIADLIGQLEIDRLARLKINLKNHIPSTVIEHYDSNGRNVNREKTGMDEGGSRTPGFNQPENL
jgi:hypothetical protein